MKRNTNLLLFIPLFFLLGCTTDPVTLPNDTGSGPVNFDAMKVGQKNRYIRFSISNNTIKTYLPDTLYVEITGKTDSGYIFSHYYTAGSTRGQGGMGTDSVITYHLYIKSDERFNVDYLSGTNQYAGLLVPPSNDFPLSFPSMGDVTFDSLTPLYCYNKVPGVFEGIISGVIAGGQAFGSLNLVIENLGTPYNAPGYVFIFSRNLGFIYMMRYAAPFPPSAAVGWELLP